MPDLTASEVEDSIQKTLKVQSAQSGAERIQRPDLKAQIDAHSYLEDRAAKRSGKRPFMSSVRLGA
jgi:hypothetical protein